MKKIFAAVVFMISALVLVACSNQQSLDGDYYKIYNGKENALVFKIEGDNSYYYPDGVESSATVDEKNHKINYTDKGVNFSLDYDYDSSGELTYSGPFGKDQVYKKGSEAYKRAIEKKD
ncbi:hypothetical protein ACVRXQ_06095 [Streptococcus panodentis]|uniref:Lipoprotein n=1 Tax=Streptococcus panodentis TaxID=1581472 RepID=A0ABS5AUV0_9STRE|nr:hypothetical protein [Streptococcus panodentis]MBP2620347.1 hypothetical protein [Streptococcus panodentis]